MSGFGGNEAADLDLDGGCRPLVHQGPDLRQFAFIGPRAVVQPIRLEPGVAEELHD